MLFDSFKNVDCDELISKVSKKQMPIFLKYRQEEQRSIYRYLFSRRPKGETPSLKNRLIGLYNPMADRTCRFSDGLRFCVNVYTGCSHNCIYCYVNAYSPQNVGVAFNPKKDFERKFLADINELSRLEVPSAPLHMSNSTDPLQENLESRYGHTLYALEKIRDSRDLFTSVVILTKNPSLLCDEPYLSIISNRSFQPFTVQVSCAFWRDDVRRFFELNAPSVENRLSAINTLVKNGVNVELRLDPLFPSARIDENIRLHRALPFYSIPEAQTESDIKSLIRFASNTGAKAVVGSVLKVAVSKRAQLCKECFAQIYSDASPRGLRSARGGSWRLPTDYQKELLSSVAGVCAEEGIAFKHCKHDVLNRK